MKVNRDFLRRNGENYPEIAPENRDFIRFFYARSTLLFISLLSGFGALYIAIPLAITLWSMTGLCLIAFVGIRIAIWWHHG